MRTSNLAQVFTHFRNAIILNKKFTYIPFSKKIFNLLCFLRNYKIITNFFFDYSENGILRLCVLFAFKDIKKNIPLFKNCKAYNSPSRHLYYSAKKLREKVYFSTSEPGFYVVNTSLGLLEIGDAIEKRVGGNIMCAFFF